MTVHPPNSIISGVEYAIREVDGRPPTADEDFAGEVALRVVYDPPGKAVGQEHVLRGVGLVSNSGVFFNEKDERGKDVRRWQVVRKGEDGGYVAKQGLF